MKSVYKQAVRNWLFCAILSTIKEDFEKDEAGNILSYTTYVLKLNDGLFKTKKTYVGKTKILKNPKKELEEFITCNPAEFVKFLFGEGVKPEDVATFELSYNIMNRQEFRWADRRDAIKEQLKKFLRRVKLPIPTEMKDENHE